MNKARSFISFLMIFFSVSLLFGCTANSEKGDPFSVFSKDFSAELDAEINGQMLSLLCQRQGSVSKITLTSPNTLAGFTFVTDGEMTSLKVGDTEADASGRIAFLPELILSAISVKTEDITEIKAENADGMTLTVVKTAGTVYRFDKTGTPTCIEGTINGTSVKLMFKSFSLASSSESAGAIS